MNRPVQIYEAGALAYGAQACPAGIARQETSSFTKGFSQRDNSPNELKEPMNTTTEANTPRLISSAREPASRPRAKLRAQWRSGLQTLGWYEQRKLRLLLVSLPLDANQSS